MDQEQSPTDTTTVSNIQPLTTDSTPILPPTDTIESNSQTSNNIHHDLSQQQCELINQPTQSLLPNEIISTSMTSSDETQQDNINEQHESISTPIHTTEPASILSPSFEQPPTITTTETQQPQTINSNNDEMNESIVSNEMNESNQPMNVNEMNVNEINTNEAIETIEINTNETIEIVQDEPTNVLMNDEQTNVLTESIELTPPTQPTLPTQPTQLNVSTNDTISTTPIETQQSSDENNNISSTTTMNDKIESPNVSVLQLLSPIITTHEPASSTISTISTVSTSPAPDSMHDDQTTAPNTQTEQQDQLPIQIEQQDNQLNSNASTTTEPNITTTTQQHQTQQQSTNNDNTIIMNDIVDNSSLEPSMTLQEETTDIQNNVSIDDDNSNSLDSILFTPTNDQTLSTTTTTVTTTIKSNETQIDNEENDSNIYARNRNRNYTLPESTITTTSTTASQPLQSQEQHEQQPQSTITTTQISIAESTQPHPPTSQSTEPINIQPTQTTTQPTTQQPIPTPRSTLSSTVIDLLDSDDDQPPISSNNRTTSTTSVPILTTTASIDGDTIDLLDDDDEIVPVIQVNRLSRLDRLVKTELPSMVKAEPINETTNQTNETNEMGDNDQHDSDTNEKVGRRALNHHINTESIPHNNGIESDFFNILNSESSDDEVHDDDDESNLPFEYPRTLDPQDPSQCAQYNYPGSLQLFKHIKPFNQIPIEITPLIYENLYILRNGLTTTSNQPTTTTTKTTIPQYFCSLCEHPIMDDIVLEQHIKLHSLNIYSDQIPDYQITCEFCYLTFPNKHEKKLHRMTFFCQAPPIAVKKCNRNLVLNADRSRLWQHLLYNDEFASALGFITKSNTLTRSIQPKKEIKSELSIKAEINNVLSGATISSDPTTTTTTTHIALQPHNKTILRTLFPILTQRLFYKQDEENSQNKSKNQSQQSTTSSSSSTTTSNQPTKNELFKLEFTPSKSSPSIKHEYHQNDQMDDYDSELLTPSSFSLSAPKPKSSSSSSSSSSSFSSTTPKLGTSLTPITNTKKSKNGQAPKPPQPPTSIQMTVPQTFNLHHVASLNQSTAAKVKGTSMIQQHFVAFGKQGFSPQQIKFMEYHASTNVAYWCRICNQPVSPNTISHNVSHARFFFEKEYEFSCFDCCVSYSYLSMLEKHLNNGFCPNSPKDYVVVPKAKHAPKIKTKVIEFHLTDTTTTSQSKSSTSTTSSSTKSNSKSATKPTTTSTTTSTSKGGKSVTTRSMVFSSNDDGTNSGSNSSEESSDDNDDDIDQKKGRNQNKKTLTPSASKPTRTKANTSTKHPTTSTSSNTKSTATTTTTTTTTSSNYNTKNHNYIDPTTILKIKHTADRHPDSVAVAPLLQCPSLDLDCKTPAYTFIGGKTITENIISFKTLPFPANRLRLLQRRFPSAQYWCKICDAPVTEIVSGHVRMHSKYIFDADITLRDLPTACPTCLTVTASIQAPQFLQHVTSGCCQSATNYIGSLATWLNGTDAEITKLLAQPDSNGVVKSGWKPYGVVALNNTNRKNNKINNIHTMNDGTDNDSVDEEVTTNHKNKSLKLTNKSSSTTSTTSSSTTTTQGPRKNNTNQLHTRRRKNDITLKNGVVIDVLNTDQYPDSKAPLGSLQIDKLMSLLSETPQLTKKQIQKIEAVELDANRWCTICDSAVARRHAHIQQHSRFFFQDHDDLYTCEDCYSTFDSQPLLDVHYDSPYCPKSSKYINILGLKHYIKSTTSSNSKSSTTTTTTTTTSKGKKKSTTMGDQSDGNSDDDNDDTDDPYANSKICCVHDKVAKTVTIRQGQPTEIILNLADETAINDKELKDVPGSLQLKQFIVPLKSCGLSKTHYQELRLVRPDSLYWCYLCNSLIPNEVSHVRQHSHYFYAEKENSTTCHTCFVTCGYGVVSMAHKKSLCCPHSKSYMGQNIPSDSFVRTKLAELRKIYLKQLSKLAPSISTSTTTTTTKNSLHKSSKSTNTTGNSKSNISKGSSKQIPISGSSDDDNDDDDGDNDDHNETGDDDINNGSNHHQMTDNDEGEDDDEDEKVTISINQLKPTIAKKIVTLPHGIKFDLSQKQESQKDGYDFIGSAQFLALTTKLVTAGFDPSVAKWIRNALTNARRFCHLCNTPIACGKNLRSHILLHSNYFYNQSQEASCDICCQSFQYKSLLKKHTQGNFCPQSKKYWLLAHHNTSLPNLLVAQLEIKHSLRTDNIEALFTITDVQIQQNIQRIEALRKRYSSLQIENATINNNKQNNKNNQQKIKHNNNDDNGDENDDDDEDEESNSDFIVSSTDESNNETDDDSDSNSTDSSDDDSDHDNNHHNKRTYDSKLTSNSKLTKRIIETSDNSNESSSSSSDDEPIQSFGCSSRLQSVIARNQQQQQQQQSNTHRLFVQPINMQTSQMFSYPPQPQRSQIQSNMVIELLSDDD